jgi:hypothetical protein
MELYLHTSVGLHGVVLSSASLQLHRTSGVFNQWVATFWTHIRLYTFKNISRVRRCGVECQYRDEQNRCNARDSRHKNKGLVKGRAVAYQLLNRINKEQFTYAGTNNDITNNTNLLPHPPLSLSFLRASCSIKGGQHNQVLYLILLIVLILRRFLSLIYCDISKYVLFNVLHIPLHLPQFFILKYSTLLKR